MLRASAGRRRPSLEALWRVTAGLGAGALLAMLVLVGSGATSAAEASAGGARVARRVLVVSLPGVAWEDVEVAEVPHLRRLLGQSAVANLAVRVTGLVTAPGPGYATLGAGTRALAPSGIAGLAVGASEGIESGSGAEAFERRTGRTLDGEVGHLGLGALGRENADSAFDATLGMLGDRLAAAGIARGVVGNADSVRRSTYPPAPPEAPRREATLAVMDGRGAVSCGVVDQSLLVDDPESAFGLRSDVGRVVAAFEKCWGKRSVVLVEASDLRRAVDFRDMATTDRAEELVTQALVDADALVARLLEHVDRDRDAVVVVAPSSRPGREARLGVLAVRAPGMGVGLLESGVTRQPGFASIVDVAPTIAALAGAPLDEAEIEGRPVTIARRGGSPEERLDALVRADGDARFRDHVLIPFATVFICLQVAVSGVFAWSLWRGRAFPRALEVATLALLGSLPFTYWAGLLPFRTWGEPAYFAFTFGGGLALALLADRVLRHPLGPPAALLGSMILTTFVSVVLLKSKLQLSTVFGDSPIVAGRFSGINNVTFALLMVAAIVLAVFLRHSLPSSRSPGWIAALLGSVLLIDVAPMWGADVGGILAGVPGLALTFWLLMGRRVRLRHAVIWALTAVAVLALLGGVDLLRDPSERTHLGRLLERIGAEGLPGLLTVLDRKRTAMVTSLGESVWRFMAVPALLTVGYLIWRAPRQIRGLRERIPDLDAGLIGMSVVGVLGFALNDSGIAVPGAMLGVVVPTAIYLSVRVGREPETAERAP